MKSYEKQKNSVNGLNFSSNFQKFPNEFKLFLYSKANNFMLSEFPIARFSFSYAITTFIVIKS